jgi:transposase
MLAAAGMAGQDARMRSHSRIRQAAAAQRQALQDRRLAAAELFGQGQHPALVARTLGVSRQSTTRWHAAWTIGGTGALESKGPSGPPPRLSDQDLERVRQALLQGAVAHGFTGELWTLNRITTVIERLTGVAYHPGWVWAILRQRLGWSVQRPVRRAAERDQAAIQTWVERDWPRIKQTRDDAKPD